MYINHAIYLTFEWVACIMIYATVLLGIIVG